MPEKWNREWPLPLGVEYENINRMSRQVVHPCQLAQSRRLGARGDHTLGGVNICALAVDSHRGSDHYV